ncbi:endonuclease [Tenacibaculum agarivorans]|uniref:endonuclease n=1 Tax=Tenacibaculum agarivorans TaxID=1908389 RepID=UPI00094BB456|nr:endonuclease [Tenacibaculum agarivorans]
MKKIFLLASFLQVLSVFAQQSYYDDVDLTKTGLDLKSELATKIIATHTNFLSYTPGVWEASRKTDVNPNNASEVVLIYGYSSSGKTARTRGINNNGGDSGEWNREHVYPRSLGNPKLETRTGDAGTDAHSLRPSDVDYNRDRGNLRFADGSGNSGSTSGGWYPGDEWKGDVARMMMYMYLRYGNRCLPSVVGVGSSAATPDDMIDLFLEWNAEDPVSEIEDNRNSYHENTANTYAQGNRNPFIDNPNLATKIWDGPVAQDRWATASIEDENILSQTKVFPTVNGGIVVSSAKAITKIAVYSILGKKIFSVNNPTFTNNKFTIENLDQGIYITQIFSNAKSITKKVLVQ